MWQWDSLFWQIRWSKIDGDFLCRKGKTGCVESRLHPLPAFGNGLIRQADDLHAHLARRDHDLNFDRHTLYSLKSYRVDPRNHTRPRMITGAFTTALRVRPFQMQPCTSQWRKQEQ